MQTLVNITVIRNVNAIGIAKYFRSYATAVFLVCLLATAPLPAQLDDECCTSATPTITKTSCSETHGYCCLQLSFTVNELNPEESPCLPETVEVFILGGGSITEVIPYGGYDVHGTSPALFTRKSSYLTLQQKLDVGILCFEGPGPFALYVEWQVSGNGAEPIVCGQLIEANCCDECASHYLNANTGIADWKVTRSVDNSSNVPRDASTVAPHTKWLPPMFDTEWISSLEDLNNIEGETDFELCFCLTEETTVHIHLAYRADNTARIYLDGLLIAQSRTSMTFQEEPPDFVEGSVTLPEGQYCLKVTVTNDPGTPGANPMGLNISGGISTSSCALQVQSCCTTAIENRPPSGDEASEGRSDQTGIAPQKQIPTIFAGFEVFPNPTTKESTTIRYTLQSATEVELVVYDALGQPVATLTKGQLEGGSHKVDFNTAGLESGTYFVRLRAGGETQSIALKVLR